ncbi:sulfite exporter TauE/SafE family protein [Nonomuraea sp. NPDC050663]|uniref:sulfite exporter TauE/SafE family protein n=1 Tax=Nonomuraea sp. NPDC050663 TaxID=3364370 RepID=UPI003793E8DE
MEPVSLFLSGLAAGLVAGTASCTAVQGGLLVGLVDRTDRCGGGCCASCRPPRADPMVLGRFLTGRLASHVLAGALLGLAGSAITLSPRLRAVLLVAAGLTVLVFAVRLIRREKAGCAPHEPPRHLGRSALLLGAATILIPCGVTLGMEMVAVSSGSALGGAAVMAGFVVGTAPAFALLGVILRRISQTRLALLTGVAAFAVGVWTIGSGLSLGGWLPRSTAPAAASTGPLTIWATAAGYRPALVTAPAGQAVELVFKTHEAGCTRTVTIAGRDYALPATVRLPPHPPGTLRYTCSMGMYSGFIRFTRDSTART